MIKLLNWFSRSLHDLKFFHLNFQDVFWNLDTPRSPNEELCLRLFLCDLEPKLIRPFTTFPDEITMAPEAYVSKICASYAWECS